MMKYMATLPTESYITHMLFYCRNSQGTLKKFTVHNMPYMIHQPTENLVLTAFKMKGLKLPPNVLYILGIQYHMCITLQHTSYIKAVRWNFTVTIQELFSDCRQQTFSIFATNGCMAHELNGALEKWQITFW